MNMPTASSTKHEPAELAAYLFVLTKCHHRTAEPIGKTVGVVFAVSADQAQEKAWEMAGGETSCNLSVSIVPEEGCCFTVYKSAIK